MHVIFLAQTSKLSVKSSYDSVVLFLISYEEFFFFIYRPISVLPTGMTCHIVMSLSIKKSQNFCKIRAHFLAFVAGQQL